MMPEGVEDQPCCKHNEYQEKPLAHPRMFISRRRPSPSARPSGVCLESERTRHHAQARSNTRAAPRGADAPNARGVRRLFPRAWPQTGNGCRTSPSKGALPARTRELVEAPRETKTIIAINSIGNALIFLGVVIVLIALVGKWLF